MEHKKPTTEPSIKVSMTPQDANIHATIFGGVILSYMDLAGAVQARREGCERCVTIAMKEVTFKQPVFVGDIVSFYTETKRIGKTSITVGVHVWAERFRPVGDTVWVTEGEVTYVNVHDDRTPREIPPRRPTTKS